MLQVHISVFYSEEVQWCWHIKLYLFSTVNLKNVAKMMIKTLLIILTTWSDGSRVNSEIVGIGSIAMSLVFPWLRCFQSMGEKNCYIQCTMQMKTHGGKSQRQKKEVADIGPGLIFRCSLTQKGGWAVMTKQDTIRQGKLSAPDGEDHSHLYHKVSSSGFCLLNKYILIPQSGVRACFLNGFSSK